MQDRPRRARTDRGPGSTDWRRLSAAVGVAVLTLTACSADEPTPDDDAAAEETDASLTADDAAERRVQDLLVVESLRTVRDDGTVDELLDDVLEGLDPDGLGAPIALGPDATFRPAAELLPGAVRADGSPRPDLDVVAGPVEHVDGSRGLLVIGSSDPEQGAPIGTSGELATLDLTFLGDLLQPGDPLLVDHAFGQLVPLDEPDDEAGLGWTELAELRFARGAVQWLATRGDDPRPRLLTGQVGRVVEGSTEAQMPFKASPMLEGFEEGATDNRGGLGGVKDFFDAFGDGALESLELLVDNFPPLLPPRDPTPPTRPMCPIGEVCSLNHGDPHVTTFDGTRYSLQAVGEFVLVRGDDIEVQARFTGLPGDSASVPTAVAIGAGDHVVEVGRHVEGGMAVDGEPMDVATLAERGLQVGDLTVSTRGGAVEVRTPAGLTVHVLRNGRTVGDLTAISLRFAADPAAGTAWAGLQGNTDGDDSNDLRTRDGRLPDGDGLDATWLYDEFGEGWRITQEESLLSYGPGQDTTTFTDRSFPATTDPLSQVDAGRRAFAAAICGEVGVTEPVSLAACVLDVATTGNAAFAADARFAQALALGEFSPDGGGGPGDVASDPTLPAGTVWATDLGDDAATGRLGRPVAADGLVAALRSTPGADESTLVVLSAEDGVERWRRDDVARLPAITSDGHVAVLEDADEGEVRLLLLDGESGAVRAEEALGDGFDLHLRRLGDALIVVDGTSVRSIDPAGSVAWQQQVVDLGSTAQGPRPVAVVDDRVVVAGVLRGSVVVQQLDLADGDVVGQLALPDLGSAHALHRVPGEAAVVLHASGDGVLARLDLADGDPTLAWSTELGAEDTFPVPPREVVVTDARVVGWTSTGGGPGLAALDVADGQPAWQLRTDGFQDRSVFPYARTDGTVVLSTSTSWLQVVDRDGVVTSVLEAPEGVSSSGPGIVGPLVDDRVLLGNLAAAPGRLLLVDPG